MFKGFRDFISRGNVLDLAIAVAVGAAFAAVITAVVDNLINPIIGLIFNADNLKNAIQLAIPGSNTTIGLGAILAALITFVATAAVLYYFFVVPMNKLFAAKKAATKAELTELQLLIEIRDLLAKR